MLKLTILHNGIVASESAFDFTDLAQVAEFLERVGAAQTASFTCQVRIVDRLYGLYCPTTNMWLAKSHIWITSDYGAEYRWARRTKEAVTVQHDSQHLVEIREFTI